MAKQRYTNTQHTAKHVIGVGFWSFVLAGVASLISQTVVDEITFISITVLFLLIVIFIGIFFDIIGVAVTAADEVPLHAKASCMVFGAKQAVLLVRHAHRVASFCNDVVGDISGTLSGALGITILFKILDKPSDLVLITGTTVTTALIASLVIAGKAYGKSFAITNGTAIIFRVGRVIAKAERLLPVKFFTDSKQS
jgi:Mg2+/Co2+ transporter CorB